MHTHHSAIIVDDHDSTGIILHLLREIARLAYDGNFTEGLADRYAQRIDALNFQRIMNRREAAAFLGISLRTLDRWVRDDGLPSRFRQVSPGKRSQRIFLLGDTLEWMERHLTSFPTMGGS